MTAEKNDNAASIAGDIDRTKVKFEIYGEEMIEKIVEGKLTKWYEEVCLLKQPFIKDEDLTIEQLIKEKIAKIGEKIEIDNFVRFQV